MSGSNAANVNGPIGVEYYPLSSISPIKSLSFVSPDTISYQYRCLSINQKKILLYPIPSRLADKIGLEFSPVGAFFCKLNNTTCMSSGRKRRRKKNDGPSAPASASCSVMNGESSERTGRE